MKSMIELMVPLFKECRNGIQINSQRSWVQCCFNRIL